MLHSSYEHDPGCLELTFILSSNYLEQRTQREVEFLGFSSSIYLVCQTNELSVLNQLEGVQIRRHGRGESS